MNELTTSGALPARIAATIFVSVMPPTTESETSLCCDWYSAASFLNAVSSWPALQPTQTVSFVGPCLLAGAPPATPADRSTSTARSAADVATRFIETSFGGWAIP